MGFFFKKKLFGHYLKLGLGGSKVVAHTDLTLDIQLVIWKLESSLPVFRSSFQAPKSPPLGHQRELLTRPLNDSTSNQIYEKPLVLAQKGGGGGGK